MGDIVDPHGIEFNNPLPLLWQHQHDKPVGHANFHTPTKEGISFSADVARIEEPGLLKDLTDMAWQAVKAGLVRGVSIGFRALEQAGLKGGGIHWQRTEVLELSLVTIPANLDATILAVKALDIGRPAGGPVLLLTVEREDPYTRGAVRLIKPH